MKWAYVPRWLSLLIVLSALLASLTVGAIRFAVQAASCSPWYTCPVTQYYGASTEYGGENGTDFYTHGLEITALLPGTVTYDAVKYWDTPPIQDITWKLDHPVKGQAYAYVQIKAHSDRVKVGQHITGKTVLGTSWSFIEYGLSPDREYGTSGWHWGADPLSVVRAGVKV
jgi:hypothetical protein